MEIAHVLIILLTGLLAPSALGAQSVEEILSCYVVVKAAGVGSGRWSGRWQANSRRPARVRRPAVV